MNIQLLARWQVQDKWGTVGWERKTWMRGLEFSVMMIQWQQNLLWARISLLIVNWSIRWTFTIRTITALVKMSTNCIVYSAGATLQFTMTPGTFYSELSWAVHQAQDPISSKPQQYLTAKSYHWSLSKMHCKCMEEDRRSFLKISSRDLWPLYSTDNFPKM